MTAWRSPEFAPARAASARPLCETSLLSVFFAPLPADDAEFRALFTKSPIKRIGRDRFVRNVLIAIGNSGDVSLVSEAERLLSDASPLVRGAAVWALSQLIGPEQLASIAQQHAGAECDDDVRSEWRAARALS